VIGGGLFVQVVNWLYHAHHHQVGFSLVTVVGCWEEWVCWRSLQIAVFVGVELLWDLQLADGVKITALMVGEVMWVLR
jgi:hypothetical protein